MNRTFPPLFLERIKQILPENEVEDYLRDCTDPLPRTIRWNTIDPLQVTSYKLQEHIPNGWNFKPLPEMPSVGFLDREDHKELPLGHTPQHFSGRLYSATLSSLLAVEVLNPEPGDTVLDCCGAPGSKTSFLADKMKNQGLLVANEMDGKRLQKLNHNLNRMGVLNTLIVQYDGSQIDRFIGEKFDKILLDAPCSSEGFGRKDSSFFEKSWDISHVYEMAKIQKKLILSAFRMLKPGGTMVYSTCTGAPEENEMVVQHLLDHYGDSIEMQTIDIGSIPHHEGLSHWDNRDIEQEISSKVKRFYPHLRSKTWDSEGFFISLIKKKNTLGHEGDNGFFSCPYKILKTHESNNIFTQIKKRLGVDLDKSQYNILKHSDGALILTTPETAEFCTIFPHKQVGLLMLDKHGNPGTEFAIHFGKHSPFAIELTEEQTISWFKGQDISPDHDFDPGTIVFLKQGDCGLGWGKCLKGGKIKNKVPRGLIW